MNDIFDFDLSTDGTGGQSLGSDGWDRTLATSLARALVLRTVRRWPRRRRRARFFFSFSLRRTSIWRMRERGVCKSFFVSQSRLCLAIDPFHKHLSHWNQLPMLSDTAQCSHRDCVCALAGRDFGSALVTSRTFE